MAEGIQLWGWFLFQRVGKSDVSQIAGVTYFWNILAKFRDGDDLPWGVASLIARRNNDGVKYDLRFPKTGGREEIDICIRKRVAEGKKGFKATLDVIATHPWYGGKQTYWRFYMWTKGDGAWLLCFLTSVIPTLAPTPHSRSFILEVLRNGAW
ncbi:hypothetical protein E1B28_009328 [Marasmius oreades]|uniref:Uncharacterized protein n=1 Tax=Marasmius oreades TaxID=181124 RepID=A0A9P7UV75_9AGAR|nr:uncharacterized protein E1B28_009328 [Marasmius oreades]KAG7093034.1 hypothetical protein E1B28_009328 [Marasmius oreades]